MLVCLFSSAATARQTDIITNTTESAYMYRFYTVRAALRVFVFAIIVRFTKVKSEFVFEKM